MNKDEKLLAGICCARIEKVPVARLKPHKGNARKHPRAQIAKIAESIKTFGWLTPILIDRDHTIIAGHGRVMAAELLGLMSVPAIRLDHLSQRQMRAYMLADNRLAELAEWDKETLEHELAELKSLDLDFDLEITGFDLDQLDVSFDANDQDQGIDRAQAAAPGQAKKQSAKKNATIGKNPPRDEDFRPVSRPSDHWISGTHRLICGRALYDNDICLQLMQGERAQMAFTVLPINTRIEPSPELGAAKRIYFDGIHGHLKPDELTSHLVEGLNRQFSHCETNAAQFLLMPTLAANEVLEASRFLYPIDEIRDFGAKLLFIAGPKLESLACREPGDSNILLEMAVRDREAAAPWQLAKEAILEASSEGDIVLDVHGSGGATLMACEETGRCARVIELSGAKVDAVIRRWQDLTGQDALLEQTGQTFSELSRLRALEPKDLNPYHDPVLEEVLFQQKGDAPCLRPRA